jgi:hypothetical protein
LHSETNNKLYLQTLKTFTIMKTNTTTWNTANLPSTIEVNGYTITLERKERETSDTRTKGLQTLYFGTITDKDGNISEIDGKPLQWVKKRVGDNNARCYTRNTDGLRVRKIQSAEEIDSSVDNYRAKCERVLEDLRKLTANGYTDGAKLPDWWHTMVSAASIAISEATAVYRCQLEDYNREQQARAIAHAEQARARQAKKSATDADWLAFLAWKESQSAQE